MKHPESHNEYAAVLFLLGNTHRVIRCRDDIQFILQSSYATGWKNLSFCLHEKSLLRCIAEKGLQHLYDANNYEHFHKEI